MTMDLPTTDDRPVWDLWLSMYHAPAVTAAIELDVFEALATAPATHEELARRLKLSERATEIVLPLFAALGLLSRYEGRYQLSDVARLYLLRGSPYDWGGLLNRMGPSSPHHAAIREALKGERASTTGAPGDRPSDAWAAGHVEKSREVTSSGPYRHTRHPLYLGSTLLGVGFAVAANHLWLGLGVVVYLAATLGAAIRAEEAHLRDKFGDAYDAYASRRVPPSDRRFSWARAIANREHHAVAGTLAGLSLLLIKVWYSQGFVGR